MSDRRQPSPGAPGQEPLAEIKRVLGLMSPADLRERQLRDLTAEVGDALGDVHGLLTLMASDRISYSPQVLRQFAERMRRGADSIGLLLAMLEERYQP